MKKVLFLLLATGMMLIYSCTKEENLLDGASDVTQFQVAQDSYSSAKDFKFNDFAGCFNDVRNKLGKPTFEETYGRPTATTLNYTIEGKFSQLIPLVKDNRIENLFWVLGMNDGYIIPREGVFNSEENGNTAGPTAAFQLSPNDLSSDADVKIIREKLGEGFKVYTEEDRISLLELNVPQAQQTIEMATAVSKNMCDYTELADLYFIFFGFHDESGQFPEYVFDPQIMIDAISDVLPSNGYCYCPLPCILQSHLNGLADIPQDIKDQMNLTYVSIEFDLDPLFPTELMESELLVDLVYLACRPYNITDACTGEPIPFDVIRDALINPNDPLLPNVTSADFYAALNAEDYIIESPEFVGCPYMQCIYNKLLATNSATSCALMDPLFNDDEFGVKLHIEQGGNIDHTSWDPETNVATISLNYSCNGSSELDLAVASTIIHELIHAEIMMTLFDMGLDPNNMHDFEEAWDNYQMEYMIGLQNTYSLNDIHHAVMVFIQGEAGIPGGNAVDRIATILWEMNGQTLTPEHYYHLAWDGLRYIDSQWAEDTYGMDSPYFDLHQELLQATPNLSIGCS